MSIDKAFRYCVRKHLCTQYHLIIQDLVTLTFDRQPQKPDQYKFMSSIFETSLVHIQSPSQEIIMYTRQDSQTDKVQTHMLLCSAGGGRKK